MTEAPAEDSSLPALTWLWGARVQRVDAPEPQVFVLTLYERGMRQSLVVALEAQRCGVGALQTRPHGQAASAFVRRLRVLIENARLESAHHWPAPGQALSRALALHFVRREESARLVADFDTQQPNLFILAADGRIMGAADERARRSRFPAPKAIYAPPTRGNTRLPGSADEAAALGTQLLQRQTRDAEEAVRARARAQAKAALRRALRKRAAIQGDLERAQGAPHLRREANALLCHLQDVARGAGSVRLPDPASEPPEMLDIALDPALSPEQNAERKFARARRLARGVSIATQRLAEAEREVGELSAFTNSLEAAPLAQLSELAQALGLRLGSATPAGVGRSERQQGHTPHRVFEGSGGARIFVGKGAADNDTLTLTMARPHDLWLHARGIDGAHVVVPRERQAEIAPELLLDAAHLAAHFSAARGEALVEIQHTERRYVRKPKGSAAGAVRIDRERTLLLRVEPARLARLLASER